MQTAFNFILSFLADEISDFFYFKLLYFNFKSDLMSDFFTAVFIVLCGYIKTQTPCTKVQRA